MDALPVGWTLHTGDQEGAGTGLLRAADTDNNTHVQDLFHEDAQVRCVNPLDLSNNFSVVSQ